MPQQRYYRRLRRYAWCSVLQTVAAVLVAIHVVGTRADGLLLVVVLVAMFWAWGAYQAEIALNDRFDDRDRRVWRIVLACVPGAIALYFHRHIRQS